MVKNKQSMLDDTPNRLVVQDYNRLKFQNKVKESFQLNLEIMHDIEWENYDPD